MFSQRFSCLVLLATMITRQGRKSNMFGFYVFSYIFGIATGLATKVTLDIASASISMLGHIGVQETVQFFMRQWN